MVIQPKVRGFVCITAHPQGCAAHVREQIEHVHKNDALEQGPKNVLVIGASTGYGLASRIAAAFGSGAKTLGIFFERPSLKGKPASAGWYNTAAFHEEAAKAGLWAKSLNGDAFSDEMKEKTLAVIEEEMGPLDLVVYSLASPRRTHPKTGDSHKSVLKPIGHTYQNKSLDTDRAEVIDIAIEPATEEEIADTVAVMGGEDWKFWMEALEAKGLLADGAKTVAYDYIGPEVTWPIYKNGTIGQAKEHVKKTAGELNTMLAPKGGEAVVSVNKALVTQASSAIPVVPLYISLLYKVMKEKGSHEGCIEQMDRLLRGKLYAGESARADGLIRLDDYEMEPDVQAKVAQMWPQVTSANLREVTDFDGYQKEFLKLFGFGLPGVDYEAETEPEVGIKGLVE